MFRSTAAQAVKNLAAIKGDKCGQRLDLTEWPRVIVLVHITLKVLYKRIMSIRLHNCIQVKALASTAPVGSKVHKVNCVGRLLGAPDGGLKLLLTCKGFHYALLLRCA